jgi:hypothetical protein
MGYQLPTLPAIEKVSLSSDGIRIAPFSVLALLKRVQKVDHIVLEVDDREERDIKWREDNRNGIGVHISLSSITNIGRVYYRTRSSFVSITRYQKS